MSPNGSLPSNNFRQDITSTAAPPSIDHPDLDLLIRSASSLLSLICKQAKAPERSEISNTNRRLSSFLSRNALLLITKDEGDIAAVSLVLETSGSEPGSSDAKFKTLWNTRNSPPAEKGDMEESKKMALPEILSQDGGKWEPSEDWLSDCCKKKKPLDHDEHVAQLNYILSRSTTDPGRTAALERFVYYQCIHKIRKRFNTRFRGCRRKMHDLFLGDKVTKEDFVDQFVPRGPEYWQGKIDEKVLQRGDQQITRLWHSTDTPRFTAETDGNPNHYVLNAEIAFEIHRLTCSEFKKISSAIQLIKKSRRHRSGVEMNDLEGALTDLGEGISSLSQSLRAPIFWKYLYHPAIIKWVQDQEMENLKTTQFDPSREIGSWLKRLAQWASAISELTDERARYARLIPGLQLKTIITPRVHRPGEQAGLFDLLREVLKDSDKSKLEPQDAVKLLKGAAIKKSKDERSEKELEKRFKNWSTTFHGKYHCESVLGSLMNPGMLDNTGLGDLLGTFGEPLKTTGVSKRCCFCCSEFLSALDEKVTFGASSGRIHSWAFPPWVSGGQAKKRVWEALSSKIIEVLGALEGSGEPELEVDACDSGSDSGLSELG